MSKTSFIIDNHKLQLSANVFGMESIIYDGKTLSKKLIFLLKSEHDFEVCENGNTTKYKVFFKIIFPFHCKHYGVLRNDFLIREGKIIIVSFESLKVMFFMVGSGLVQHILLVSLPVYERCMMAEIFLPSSFGLTPFDQIIGAIFGSFLFMLIIFPKELLINYLHILSVIFWAYIGLTVTALGSLIVRYMREGVTLEHSGIIVYRAMFIYLLFYLLISYVELARKVRSRE